MEHANSEELLTNLLTEIIQNDNANNNQNCDKHNHGELIAKVDNIEQNMIELRKQIQQLTAMVKLLLNQRRSPTNLASDDDQKEEADEELRERIQLVQHESVLDPGEGQQEVDLKPEPKAGQTVELDGQPPNITYLINVECNGTISECGYLQRLKIKMASDDYQGADVMVEDSFHLINKHTGDDEFHFIYNALGGQCQDAVSCEKFSRNHRARDKLKNNDQLHALYHVGATAKDTIPTQQIIDKIHCHYRHCYDIGNRLPLEIQTQIQEEIQTDQKYDDYDGGRLSYFVNSTFKRVNEVRGNKYQTFGDIRRLNESNKFMMSPMDDECYGLYSFGFRFVYFEAHHRISWERFPWHIGYVPPKHGSLKQELISNEIFGITTEQFNNELTKAMLYFNRYNKTDFGKKWTRQQCSSDGYFASRAEFCVEHVLSAMIYCNYDTLQHAFSKTYRRVLKNESKEDVWKRHRNYHYLARYLSEMVSHGGLKGEATKQVLYHGISNTLVLTDPRTTKIYTPLSSTPSVAVAANFSNHKNGIIIEFEPQFYIKSNKINETVCLSCATLSDFGNEKEVLFVQSGAEFQIKNIIANTGVEYRQVLNAIGLIESSYSTYIPKYLETVHDNLIRHELNKHGTGNVKGFGAWDGIDKYAEKMIHQYCVRKQTLDIYVSQLRPLFVHDKKWINFDVLNALFPNLKVLKIARMSKGAPQHCTIRLTKSMMNSILELIQKKECKLETIQIKISQIGFNSQSAIKSFSDLFENIGFAMSVPESYDDNERRRLHLAGIAGGGYMNRGVTDLTKNYDILMISKSE
eukprot:939977_1